MTRVVVTGIGLTCALGPSYAAVVNAALHGYSGVALEPTKFGRPYVVAAIQEESESSGEIERLPVDRVVTLAMRAVKESIASARITENQLGGDETAIYFGSGFGGANSIEGAYRTMFKHGGRPRPLTVPASMVNAAAGHIAIQYRVTGPAISYATACASSAIAIGEALLSLRQGRFRRALVVGSEALLTDGLLAAWDSLRVLALPDRERPEQSCRPFSTDRTGLVLGEGAGALLLETSDDAHARGADALAELAGYGIACDATHMTAPSEDGQYKAMRFALLDAQEEASELGYINAHATGTLVGDRVEARSIAILLGDRRRSVPVSSTKAVHGHLLGAAGVVELAISIAALRAGFVPPTMHVTSQDPECDLDIVPNMGRPQPFRLAMSNSFAFGGTNVSLVVRRV